MATIAQHNRLLKFKFGYDKYFRHALTNDDVNRMTMLENRFPPSKLPVCSGCERLAYWHKGDGVCPHCGTITKNPMTFSEYYTKGYDIDKTCRKNTEMQLVERDLILPG